MYSCLFFISESKWFWIWKNKLQDNESSLIYSPNLFLVFYRIYFLYFFHRVLIHSKFYLIRLERNICKCQTKSIFNNVDDRWQVPSIKIISSIRLTWFPNLLQSQARPLYLPWSMVRIVQTGQCWVIYSQNDTKVFKWRGDPKIIFASSYVFQMQSKLKLKHEMFWISAMDFFKIHLSNKTANATNKI